MNDAELLDSMSFCVFDLETTGGNQATDQIIEIALVKIEKRKIVDEKHLFIKPDIEIPVFIQRLTSIGPKEMKNAFPIEKVIDDITHFMGDSILVAHNVSFDVPFFNSVLRRLKKTELKNRTLCTVLMTKYLIPDLLNSNLNYMSKIFGIEHNKAHRALDDTRATAKLLLKYLEIFESKGITKINHLYYPKNRYELDRINVERAEGLELIEKKMSTLKTPALVTFKGDNGIILFSVPTKGRKEEWTYIKKQANNLNWQMASLRIFGSFFEAFVYFSSYFVKIDPEIKNSILQFLWNLHFKEVPKTEPVSKKQEEKNLPVVAEGNDFVVVPHLIPEQYLVLPLSVLSTKGGLVFRFPSHKKKLFQYVSSKSSKLTAGKVKKTFLHPSLTFFINRYLESEKENAVIFKKTMPFKNEAEFVAMIEGFIKKNPHKTIYPKEYL